MAFLEIIKIEICNLLNNERIHFDTFYDRIKEEEVKTKIKAQETMKGKEDSSKKSIREEEDHKFTQLEIRISEYEQNFGKELE